MDKGPAPVAPRRPPAQIEEIEESTGLRRTGCPRMYRRHGMARDGTGWHGAGDSRVDMGPIRRTSKFQPFV